MPFTTDFKAFGTGANALVIPPTSLGSQPFMQGGFNGGVADAASLNSLWRQSTFVAAGITQWMANILSQNIFDDGNLNNFISLFGSALTKGSNGGVSSINTRTGAVVLLLLDVTSALGYTPVKSFNGPGGPPRNGPVNMIQADVNEALGYTPLNRGGDTMSGFLAGPEPSSSPNYATKNYVDRSLGGTVAGAITSVSSVNGNAIEWDFPLPFGGIMKVGWWVTQVGSAQTTINGMQDGATYQINFVRPFPSVCAGVTLEAIGVAQGACDVILASLPTTTGFSIWDITTEWDTSPQELLHLNTNADFIWGTIWIAYGF